MKCKRCGKALGTDRGICPFCGAMLTQSQMEIYKQDKRERMLKPELLTEKYGEKPIYYEKRKNEENKIIGIVIVLGVILILLIIVLITCMK